MVPPPLTHTQRLLWRLITAPEGAAAALAQLDPAEQAATHALVAGDDRLSVLERLDIYANMYFYRIRDALKEDFPTVCAVVGEANFHNLITDYLITHPPSHFSLRYVGAHLPPFLAGHALSDQWPYLGDLARLEWAVLDAFDAADAPVLAEDDLTGVSAERWPEIRFQATPSLRLVDVEWPVQEIWRQLQSNGPPAQPLRARTLLRVWRQDFRVYHCPITAAERTALAAIASGAPFAEVCEHIVACAGEAEGAERTSDLLRQWLHDGVLSSFRLVP